MKIQKVEIKDYKAFYGKNEFNVDGKNLFIYGENGSGKSSFYYALKDLILDKFGHNIELKLNYTQAKPTADYKNLERNHVRVKIKYLGKEIDKPHIFLNEARLSAIAISIYLGMVKRHIQGIPCKVLFLDDIFIGLDISNRLPLLEILKSDFANYQVFITTYDKPWYEFVRINYLNNNRSRKCFEIYAGRSKKGFTIPVVKEIKGQGNNEHLDYFIQTAENFHNSGDNKAAGVYLRSAFEAILKQFCFGKVTVKFVIDQSKLKTNGLLGSNEKP